MTLSPGTDRSIVIIRGQDLRSKRINPIIRQQIEQVIDKMGRASQKVSSHLHFLLLYLCFFFVGQAQGLNHPITSAGKLMSNDNKIIIKSQGNRCIGIIKVGVKKLFVQDWVGKMIEITPLCVLDFYVNESVQRGGHGRQLFETMLEEESIKPHKLAYDRPSKKFRNFLAKYYGLSNYVSQNNNFVVFDEYFQPSAAPSTFMNRENTDAFPRTLKEQDKAKQPQLSTTFSLHGDSLTKHRSSRSMGYKFDASFYNNQQNEAKKQHTMNQTRDILNSTNQSNVFSSLG